MNAARLGAGELGRAGPRGGGYAHAAGVSRGGGLFRPARRSTRALSATTGPTMGTAMEIVTKRGV
jgi:hypothetical protein